MACDNGPTCQCDLKSLLTCYNGINQYLWSNMPALPLSHYNKVWAHLIPTAFLFSCKIIRLLTPHQWATFIIVRQRELICGTRLFLSYWMVTKFYMKITMCNGIIEQTSNGTMAFFIHLMAFLSKHLTNRCHFWAAVTSNGKSEQWDTTGGINDKNPTKN